MKFLQFYNRNGKEYNLATIYNTRNHHSSNNKDIIFPYLHLSYATESNYIIQHNKLVLFFNRNTKNNNLTSSVVADKNKS